MEESKGGPFQLGDGVDVVSPPDLEKSPKADGGYQKNKTFSMSRPAQNREDNPTGTYYLKG